MAWGYRDGTGRHTYLKRLAIKKVFLIVIFSQMVLYPNNSWSQSTFQGLYLQAAFNMINNICNGPLCREVGNQPFNVNIKIDKDFEITEYSNKGVSNYKLGEYKEADNLRLKWSIAGSILIFESSFDSGTTEIFFTQIGKDKCGVSARTILKAEGLRAETKIIPRVCQFASADSKKSRR